MSAVLKVLECRQEYRYEGPRFIKLGPESGEEFRDKYLIPWLNENKDEKELKVDFAGTEVFTPSFLEESFGGAIRMGHKLVKDIVFDGMPPVVMERVKKYIAKALGKKK